MAGRPAPTRSTLPTYDDALSLRDARAIYFEVNGFDNGGYDERWVKMRAGPIPIVFPNTKARLRAVKFHDLHHVVTGYETTWAGEAEIGAWEIATGCAHHYPAWLLDFYAMAIGIFISPLRVYRAFLRGRQSANLYRRSFDEDLLSQKVGIVRRQLQLDRKTRSASANDKLVFVFWSALSVGATAGTGLILLLPLLSPLLVWMIASGKLF